ncbi:MAG: hypothetical protein L7F78_05200 [Syntrophales bacterium LBB04]|nr:hypothetical protein [Syntrophales bacterium LBB04]
METTYDLSNIPPIGSKDVAKFASELFDIARTEKDRLGKPDSFLANYALYRGVNSKRQQSYPASNRSQTANLVNLFFSNIERTVSNITAREPVGEVVDLSGSGEETSQLLSARLQKWWKDTNQQTLTRKSARSMEIYGITVEKPTYNSHIDDPEISIVDPFSFFPCPGYWDNMDTDAPYVCFAYIDLISNVAAKFKVKPEDIVADAAYDLMGTEREEFKQQSKTTNSIGHYSDRMITTRSDKTSDKKVEQCLVVEVWVRDYRRKKTVEDALVINPETADPEHVEVQEESYVCPDTVRKITITRSKEEKDCGWMVLDDRPNPNINPNLEIEIAKNTFPWGRFPVYYANSYKDLVNIWGFSAAEQTGDLILVINKIIRKVVIWVENALTPPLVLPKNIGITREMVESDNGKTGRLILMPTNYLAAQAIRYLETPNLPATFFQTLTLLVQYFDRVYQIEDADRGEAPNGVIAAKAIQALQERNQVVMQAKTSSIDSLAEYRSRWAIGLWQNFGVNETSVNVGGKPQLFIGTDYAQMKFNYVVESGSTTPRTNLQVQEIAPDLYKIGLIDQEAALKMLNIPGWREIVERMGEDQLSAALRVLVMAGMPEDEAQEVYEVLMRNQGGPGTGKGGNGANPAVEPKEAIKKPNGSGVK